MNLPNKLTMLRVIMIPFFVFFLSAGSMENHDLPYDCGLALFIVASLTDLLDGKIARKYQSGYELWKIYGSAGGQASGVLGADLSD